MTVLCGFLYGYCVVLSILGYRRMVMVRLLLEMITWVIYALFTAIILYFPVIELMGHFARETRFFKIPQAFPIEDAFLPLLCLAVIYAVITKIIPKTENPKSFRTGCTPRS